MMPNPLIALLGLYALVSAQGYGQMGLPPSKNQPAATKKAAAPAIALLPAVPGRGMRDVPNIAIKFYDVSGKDFAEIIDAIGKLRPKDPATKQVMAGGAGWGLGANVSRQTENGKCTVVQAKAEFTPTAELPRLVNEGALAPDQLAAWRAYLSHLEVPAAASLWFVLDRLPAYEKSLVGVDCDAAMKLGAEGIAKIRADHDEFQRQYAARQAASAPPAPKK